MPSQGRRKKDDDSTVSLAFDRIEAGKAKQEIAVLLTEDGTTLNIPRYLLPGGSQPGDVLSVTFRRDPEATRQVAESTRKVQEDLKATDPGGDIRL